MALFPIFILILIAPSSSNAQWPPSPGYWPSSRFRSMSFYQGYRNLWGYSHQRVEQNALTIWLDRTSGYLDQIINSWHHLSSLLGGIYLIRFLLVFLICWFWSLQQEVGLNQLNHFDQGILLPPSSSSLVTLPESLQLSMWGLNFTVLAFSPSNLCICFVF